MEHMLLLAREWVWHLLCPVLTFNRRRPLREILQYSSTRICQKNINKSKCFLTQNTSQWNVLFTSFKVLFSHIRWFSRWFGLWFQGNKLIQGKNLRGSFVNVLNLSLSAGNIFKASIDTALNLGKSFWLKYLEPVRKFWVKGILSQKVLSLKYHILDNNGAFNLSSEKYANVSTAKKHIYARCTYIL